VCRNLGLWFYCAHDRQERQVDLSYELLRIAPHALVDGCLDYSISGTWRLLLDGRDVGCGEHPEYAYLVGLIYATFIAGDLVAIPFWLLFAKESAA
jgi:hypothetical protein